MSQQKSALLIPFFSPSSVLGSTTPGGEGASSVTGPRRGERSVDILVGREGDERLGRRDVEMEGRPTPTEQARFSRLLIVSLLETCSP